MALGSTIYRFRWALIAGWLLATVALCVFAPKIDQILVEKTTFLPEGCSTRLANDILAAGFPSDGGLSEATIVFERRDVALGDADRKTIEKFAGDIRVSDNPSVSADLSGVKIQSPATTELPAFPGSEGLNPLVSKVSPAGQAAIVRVGIPYNFVTGRSARLVDHIRGVLSKSQLPAGLVASVTGSAGFGRDYGQATKDSHRVIMHVTLISVLAILLIVYRAPLAAFIPLGAVSMAAIAVLKLLDIGQMFGIHAGSAERIFVCALIYGSGTDYSMLVISRYRECLSGGMESRAAVESALNSSLGGILAAACTNAGGLFMLFFAKFGIFSTTGPSVAIAIALAFLATITIVPALLAVFGRATFWPMHPRPQAVGGEHRSTGGGFWWRLAGVVTARPALMLVACIVLLAIPAVGGSRVKWVYDTLSECKPTFTGGVGSASAGVEAAMRHWPVGQIAPVVVVASSPSPQTLDYWRQSAKKFSGELEKLSGVADIRSLHDPLGKDIPSLAKMALRVASGNGKIADHYVSSDGKTMRLYVLMTYPSLSPAAMQTVDSIRAAAVIDGLNVLIAGATAEMGDVRDVTQSDFKLVACLTMAVVLIVVMILIRRVILSIVMVATTLFGYFAAIGVTYWFFHFTHGSVGLDWKVEVFLFVVMVAVGVDYNIFLAARLFQEAKTHSFLEATKIAVAHTGPVISSCGLIMAVSLGSLYAGELTLMAQLGFAFASGMLIDTFVIRPIMLPTVAVLIHGRK